MNDPDPVVREALRWLRFSGEDLDVASRLMSDLPTARGTHAGFVPTGGGEGTEGGLVLEGRDRIHVHTHDLDALRNRLPDSWTVRTTHADLAELTEWSVETRYPGDWSEPTDADAVRAESEAREIYNSIAGGIQESRGALRLAP